MNEGLIENFKNRLLSENPDISNITLVNYLSDLKHFANWYESILKTNFDPEDISVDILELYRKSKGGIINEEMLDADSQLSDASIKRHMSSLRKFFHLVSSENTNFKNPFDDARSKLSDKSKVLWRIEEFRSSLLKNNASKVTVKNYLSDINNFTRWYEENLKIGGFEQINETPNITIYIDQNIVDRYKKSLIEDEKSSPRTTNRRLSSIRKYLEFAQKSGFVNKAYIQITNVKIE